MEVCHKPNQQREKKHGRSLHLSLSTRGRTQGSLNLGLVHAVDRQPRECTTDHQRPDSVSYQRIRIETKTDKRLTICCTT